MKKRLLVLFVAPAVTAIVLSLAVPVNRSSQIPKQKGAVVLADGVPLPPPTPPPPKKGTMVADGVPLPPPTPPPPKGGMRTADNLKALSV